MLSVKGRILSLDATVTPIQSPKVQAKFTWNLVQTLRVSFAHLTLGGLTQMCCSKLPWKLTTERDFPSVSEPG